ncbi:Hypothetical protein LUCI_2143 [Lucifera butyrica]|uniref:HTH marR-type domain-containing protein n=2 Tax=Lucifera butyrica TaxID=1351585 RepID=A0A498R9U0_9FIRM|nr:Hypothetical protein LUCI_2143 [Lucifera butyrica]
MLTADQVLVKQINKAIVLNTIQKNETVFRAEIAKKTGLNRSTVSGLVDELLADGLILETGIGISQGGRKPVILSINRNYGSIIGVDCGVNYILIVLTNFAGEILLERRIPVSAADLPEERIGLLKQLIQETINSAPSSVSGIIGIGICVPGIVNYEEGLILQTPNLNWHNVPLKKIIQDQFQIPVLIDNDANAGAIGEKWFGLGKKATDLVYLSAGIGIGTGVLIKNELYRGASGLAGEMGHVTIHMHGRRCSCGNIGCWEEYAAEKALLNFISENIGNYPATGFLDKHHIGQLTVFEIVQAAKAGDPLSIAALKHIGQQLGIGVANIINTFNPSTVIIGNTLAVAEEFILDELKAEVKARCFTAKYYPITIVCSALGIYAGAMGAASLILSRVFAAPVTQQKL